MIAPSSNQFVLEEVDELDQEPGEEEIREYAEIIGIDLDSEPELLWVARAGITAPLPPDWKPVQMNDGELYFYNFTTNESSWEHPSDEKYRQMVKEERKNLQLRNTLTKTAQNIRPSSAGAIPPRKPSPVPGSSPNPMLPPARPPSGGKLAPIGQSDTQQMKSPGSRLAPLTIGGAKQNQPAKLAKQAPPAAKKPNKQQIGLALESPASNQPPSRPKTSRGTTDRQKSAQGSQKEQTEQAPVQLKLGGARFLKSNQPNKEPEKELLKPQTERSEPEIMSFSPRNTGLNYDEVESDYSSESETSEEIHIGGSNIVLDASHLDSSASPKKHHTEKEEERHQAAKPDPIDSKGEILPKDPSNNDKVVPEKAKPSTNSEVKVRNVENDIKKMETEMENQIRQAKERIDREKAAEERKLRTEMEKSLNELKQKLEKETNEAIEKEKAAKNAELAKIKAEIDQLRKSHEEEKKGLKKRNEKELEEMKKRHASQSEAINSAKMEQETFDEERRKLKESFEKELGELEADYEGKLSKARREWKEKMESERQAQEIAAAKSQEVQVQTVDLQKELTELSSLVLSLKNELKELIDQANEAKRVQPDPPPLATSTPKKQKVKKEASLPREESMEDLKSLATDSSSSCSSSNIVERAKELIEKNRSKTVEQNFGRNLLDRNKPGAQDELTADMVHASLAQLQKDLKTLTLRVCGTENRTDNYDSFTTTVDTSKYLGNCNFVDDLIEQRWRTFSKNSTYPVTFGPYPVSRDTWTWRREESNTDQRIDQLKIWLKDFEKKLNLDK